MIRILRRENSEVDPIEGTEFNNQISQVLEISGETISQVMFSIMFQAF